MEAATESQIGILCIFCQSFLKLFPKEFIFANFLGYRPAVLLKKNSFLGISQGFYL